MNQPAKNQTAVEWLFAHLLPFLTSSDAKEREHFIKCLAEAKAMEKEQIVEAHIAGMEFIAVDPKHYVDDANDYYNSEYKGGEQ